MEPDVAVRLKLQLGSNPAFFGAVEVISHLIVFLLSYEILSGKYRWLQIPSGRTLTRLICLGLVEDRNESA